MNKFARLPANDSPRRTADAVRPSRGSRYFAFLSYSHKDAELADWLHQELEQFRVPNAIAGRLTNNGVAPRRLSPIFRDQHELAAAGDLSEEIEAALASSQFLVVLCSPDAAKSRWTNSEIEIFKRNRPDGCVLAAIASGEPFASQIPGRTAEECFPPALRQKYDRRGRPTGRLAEPLAADFRDSDGRRLALLKLIAGMLGVPLDELVQRQATSRNRRLAWLAAASLAGMAVTSTLAVTAVQSRNEAREQRREAEGLVAFMLGDLKDKLEPIGRLDTLDGVGAKVLAYYSKQDTSALSDESLVQRSRALSLMGQVAFSRGELDKAQQLYREASTGTAEAMTRDSSDPQRLYDHAQNAFYLGYIASKRGDMGEAEKLLREYKDLAERMVALDPNSLKWRVEQQDAAANLGVVLYDRRQYREAVALLSQAAQMTRALATADPANSQYQQGLAETLAWLADAQMSDGELTQAIQVREQHVALLSGLIAQPQSDVEYRRKLISSHQNLGWLYLMRGQTELGLQHLHAALSIADGLLPVEPTNRDWQEVAAQTRQALAQALLENGRLADAATQNEFGCRAFQKLLSQNSSYPSWRGGARTCWRIRASIALAAHRPDEAVSDALRAVAIGKTVKTSDVVSDRYMLAKAHLVLGDAEQARGDRAAASAAWQNALAELSGGAAEKPYEMDDHRKILMRLGRTGEAQQLSQRLSGIGFQENDRG